ncbi:helix-turn-helix domain-containing protein [Micromonosporaceae bacterium B7E4]
MDRGIAMREVYNTASLRPGQQFDHVREALRQLPMPLLVVGPRSTDIRAVFRVAEFGQVSVTLLDSCSDRPLQLRRTHRLISQSDPEAYRLVISLHGRLTCQQAGHEAQFNSGDLALFDTSLPFAWYRDAGLRPWRALIVTVPRVLLTRAVGRTKPPLCSVLPVQQRLRVQISQWLTEIVSRRAGCEQIESEETDVLIDLLEGLLTERYDQEWSNGLASKILTLRARAGILGRLGESDLCPRQIAACVGVHPRTLDKHIGATNHTVMGLVREYRLEQIYRDLTDPAKSRLSIEEIGKTWGYPDASHLSRSFSQRYHRNPSTCGHASGRLGGTPMADNDRKPRDAWIPRIYACATLLTALAALISALSRFVSE